MDSKHLLRELTFRSTIAHKERLRYRHLFVPAARKLLKELNKLSIRAKQLADYKCNAKYSKVYSALGLFVPSSSDRPLGMSLPDLLGHDLTAFALVLEDSGHLCTNEDLLLHQFVNVAHYIKPKPV